MPCCDGTITWFQNGVLNMQDNDEDRNQVRVIKRSKLNKDKYMYREKLEKN